MYIIPKDKVKKIESEVKPIYLKHINVIVKQGISDALNRVTTKKRFVDAGLEQWCKKLGKDLKDPKSDIYYKKITESYPDSLMAIYEIFRNNYNATTKVNGIDYILFEEQGFNNTRKISDLKEARKFLANCFPYNKFISKQVKYDAYKYCKAMDINVCVYCNAQLTHTVNKKGKNAIRPQIDHFYTKSRFPMFALSFYNMIPACPTCNSIKWDKFCDLGEIYHPYVDDCSDLSFKWHYKKIRIQCDSVKAEKTAEIFQTENIYNIYNSVAEKIVEKVQDYDPAYIDELIELMNSHRKEKIQLDKETVIKRICDYVPKEECFDTPLGEMRHDILEDKIKKAYM